MGLTQYIDGGYLVYQYVYRGGYEQWVQDRALYSKFAGCTIVTEGYKNIRKQLYPSYKANRDITKITEKQVEYRQKAKEIFNDINTNPMFQTVYNPILEADDILAIKALQGYPIITSDKDLAQLPEDCNIKKLDGTSLRTNLHAGIPKSLYDIPLTPDLYLLTLCLFGDKTDNVPRLIPKGVKAIKDSRKIYESDKPFEFAYTIYGSSFLDNIDMAHLPHRITVNEKLDREDVMHYISTGVWSTYVRNNTSL
jgi:hypothetical protein